MRDITPVKISLDKIKKVTTVPKTPPPAKEPAPKKEEPTISSAYLSWETWEYEFREKSPDWYWMIGIASIALIAVAIYMQNILFAIIIMLGAFSFALLSARHPNHVVFAITSRGIKINNSIYHYKDLDSFWIEYDPPHKKELIIISQRAIMPHIAIPLADTDPNEVRTHLLKFLEEKPHEESLTEILMRFIGF
jgi:hypothetical protein